MKVPLSWLREFAPVPDDPAEVASRLAGCGFEVASIEGDVVDFEITANRPDCLSIYGLAREAAVAFDVALAAPRVPDPDESGPSGRLPVSIGDAGCGRYSLALADVRIGASPEWLTSRLDAAGVRPINNVVDVTNYVMLELGHPMHAFDADRLAGPEIHVRRARAGERLTTLDGQERALDETMLVIADRDRAVALAGVMGGAASEVSGATTTIALESAWFHPASVRATSRRVGLKTEASARFERGADPTAPPRALARALALFEQIGAGRQVGRTVDLCPRSPQRRVIELRPSRLATLLGEEIPGADVSRILSGLEFRPQASDSGWRVDVPTFRVDVVREADLIEEVARHWGYDRLPVTYPAPRAMPRPSSTGVELGRTLRRVLCGAGLQEAATFTFLERGAATPFVPDGEAVVDIANPLSEKFAVLRPSLLPGLLDALVYNRRREQDIVRLFEIGTTFAATGERARVAWVMSGSRADHWSERADPIDVFDALGVADLVGTACGLGLDAGPAADAPWYVAGRAAALTESTERTAIGSVGQIRPAVVAERGLPQSEIVVAGELDLAALARHRAAEVTRITPLPRHPSVVRDLSILVDERLPAAEVRGTIRAHAPPTLVATREFDRYQGAGVPEGLVSLSLRLTFRAPDRTLTDTEVQQGVDAVVTALAKMHDARLRGGAGPSPVE